jgi:DNA-binding transcriptional LysR family regulator
MLDFSFGNAHVLSLEPTNPSVYRKDVEIKHLRSFMAVAEALSFIKAARKLHISQPALSAQIQALEAEIGVKLLERSRRSVRLTVPGETFLEDAAAILQMVSEAEIRAQRAAAGEVGHLRIGFVASAALAIVPSVVLAFRRRYPLVTLDLMNIRTTDQITQLEERKLDAGFLRLPTSSKSLVITPIHREPFVLVVPNGHRLANQKPFRLAELEHEPFVAYGRKWAPGFYDSWIQMFTSAGFSPTVVQETGEMETMLALVAAGVGIAVAPRGLVRRQVRGLTVRALPRSAPLSEIGLAVRTDQGNILTDRLVELALSKGKTH